MTTRLQEIAQLLIEALNIADAESEHLLAATIDNSLIILNARIEDRAKG